MRFHLVARGHKEFFKGCVETGGHSRSLEALLEKRADVAAIDKTVLRRLRKDRGWRQRLSALTDLEDVKELGPFPGQPFVCPKKAGPKATRDFASALISAPRDVLTPLGWERIVPMAPADYDCIRDELAKCALVDSLLCPRGHVAARLQDPSQSLAKSRAKRPSMRRPASSTVPGQRGEPTHGVSVRGGSGGEEVVLRVLRQRGKDDESDGGHNPASSKRARC